MLLYWWWRAEGGPPVLTTYWDRVESKTRRDMEGSEQHEGLGVARIRVVTEP